MQNSCKTISMYYFFKFQLVSSIERITGKKMWNKCYNYCYSFYILGNLGNILKLTIAETDGIGYGIVFHTCTSRFLDEGYTTIGFYWA